MHILFSLNYTIIGCLNRRQSGIIGSKHVFLSVKDVIINVCSVIISSMYKGPYATLFRYGFKIEEQNGGKKKTHEKVLVDRPTMLSLLRVVAILSILKKLRLKNEKGGLIIIIYFSHIFNLLLDYNILQTGSHDNFSGSSYW